VWRSYGSGQLTVVLTPLESVTLQMAGPDGKTELTSRNDVSRQIGTGSPMLTAAEARPTTRFAATSSTETVAE
jgi:hypothetical protein